MSRTSKTNSQYQFTLPKDMQSRLNIKPGDILVCDMLSDGSIVVRKMGHESEDYLYLKSVESMLSEWNSKEDDECFKELQDL